MLAGSRKHGGIDETTVEVKGQVKERGKSTLK